MSSLTSSFLMSFLMSLLMSSFLKIKYYKLKGLLSLKINSTIFKKIVPHTLVFIDRVSVQQASIICRRSHQICCNYICCYYPSLQDLLQLDLLLLSFPKFLNSNAATRILQPDNPSFVFWNFNGISSYCDYYHIWNCKILMFSSQW